MVHQLTKDNIGRITDSQGNANGDDLFTEDGSVENILDSLTGGAATEELYAYIKR